MANITLDNGARPAEVVTIRLCDVTCEPREVRIMGKGQRERFVPQAARAFAYFDRPIPIGVRRRSISIQRSGGGSRFRSIVSRCRIRASC